MDCHRTLFTLSHGLPSSRNYEQVDIIIATIHVLLVPNKRHNCPNRCEFAPDQHNATHARVHADGIKIEANQYSYLPVELHVSTDRLVCARRYHSQRNFVYHFRQFGRVRVRLYQVDFDNVGCCDDKRWLARKHTPPQKKINHQQCEPKENLEILLIFFFCILFGVARHYVHGYTAPNGIITQPRVKQSSVDFAFSRLSP